MNQQLSKSKLGWHRKDRKKYQLITVIMDLHTKNANIGSNPSPIKTIQLIHISQQQSNSLLKINTRNIIKIFQTLTFQ